MAVSAQTHKSKGSARVTQSRSSAIPSVPIPSAARPGAGNPLGLRWPVTTRDIEGRQCARRSLHGEFRLVDDVAEEKESPQIIPGECLNISDGGLYGTVPLGYGVAIGQCFTVRLEIDERGPEPGSLQNISQKGRILRAELMIGEDGYADRVGIAIQLYGHREGVIPMPQRG